jgi:DNA-binding transcriptional MerR regulator
MTAPRGTPDPPDPTRGVYAISVAADLVGTGVQNLRVYERRGLLDPQRTNGGTRLYSEDDIARLRRIADLLTAGLNLAGIAMVLELEEDNARLRDLHDRHERRERRDRPAPRDDGHGPLPS